MTPEERARINSWRQPKADVPAHILQNRVEALLDALDAADAKAARYAQLLANGASAANEAVSAVHRELQRLRGRIEERAATLSDGSALKWDLLDMLKPVHLHPGGEDK